MPLIIPGIPHRNPVTLAISINDGKVVINFGRDVRHLVLTSEEAANTARALAEASRDLLHMQGHKAPNIPNGG